MKKEYGFWLTNISNMNISLSDLNLTIAAKRSINLMDKKHYSYSFEELEKSALSGSISKRPNKLFVRMNKPEISKPIPIIVSESPRQSLTKSIFVIKEQTYEELNISDEKFAEDSADLLISEDK